MKFLNDIGDTPHKTMKKAKLQAFNELNVTEMDKINDNPETWHSVKQKISKIMGNKLLGRPTPVKKPKITVSDEMLKLKFESPFRHSYPKRLVKDTDKHNFLKEKFKQGDIQYHIYEDLVSMLDVKEEDIIPKIDFKGGVQ